MLRKIKNKILLIIYLIGVIITATLGIKSAVACHMMRWPNLPVSGMDVALNFVFPSLMWPITLPGAYVTYSINENNVCFFGGKIPNVENVEKGK